MPRKREEPVTGPDGYDHHPAFGMCRIGRISSHPGEPLFQSDLQHSQYIQLTVTQAARKRDLKRDWVHPGRVIIQVDMSMAQFASLVTSAGTEGVPVTISYMDGEQVPGIYPDSRLKRTAEEVLSAATDAYRKIQLAVIALDEGLNAKAGAAERRRLMRDLQAATANAAPNVAYAAERLSEHAEEVVERSRADIEAIIRMAQERGESVWAGDSVLALDSGTETE